MHFRDISKTILFLCACMACEPGSLPSAASCARPECPAAAASTWLKRLAAKTACCRFEVALSPSGAVLQLVTRNFGWRRVDVSPGAGCTVSVLVNQHCISWLSLSSPWCFCKRFREHPLWPIGGYFLATLLISQMPAGDSPAAWLTCSKPETQGSLVKVQVPNNP